MLKSLYQDSPIMVYNMLYPLSFTSTNTDNFIIDSGRLCGLSGRDACIAIGICCRNLFSSKSHLMWQSSTSHLRYGQTHYSQLQPTEPQQVLPSLYSVHEISSNLLLILQEMSSIPLASGLFKMPVKQQVPKSSWNFLPILCCVLLKDFYILVPHVHPV